MFNINKIRESGIPSRSNVRLNCSHCGGIDELGVLHLSFNFCVLLSEIRLRLSENLYCYFLIVDRVSSICMSTLVSSVMCPQRTTRGSQSRYTATNR